MELSKILERKTKNVRKLHGLINDELLTPFKINTKKIDIIMQEIYKEQKVFAETLEKITEDSKQKQEYRIIIERLEDKRCRLYYKIQDKKNVNN